MREACPDARLIVAGNKPERIPSFAQRPAGVEFTGFVSELEMLYRRAAIVCCPILSGGGTRIKILEAAAHGKAVVSTVVGAEGLELRDGVEIALRDGAPPLPMRASSCWGIRPGAKRWDVPRARRWRVAMTAGGSWPRSRTRCRAGPRDERSRGQETASSEPGPVGVSQEEVVHGAVARAATDEVARVEPEKAHSPSHPGWRRSDGWMSRPRPGLP